MSNNAEILAEHLGKVPEPLQSVIRSHIVDDRIGKKLEEFQARFSLTAEQQMAVHAECIMVLCSVTSLDDLKDDLIAEAGLSYETAVRVHRAFEREILDPITEEAETCGYSQTVAPPPLPQRPPPLSNEPLYQDRFCRVTYSTLDNHSTSYPISKITSVTQPLQVPFEFIGGFLLNGGLLVLGLVGLLSLSPGWMFVGLIAAAIGGFNVYGEFNRPWWITVTLVNSEEFRIKRPKKTDIEGIYFALRKTLEK